MKKPKKHVNPKNHLHQVYTEECGVKEHNKNQQAIGALKLAIGYSVVKNILTRMVDKIENMEIKALKKKGDD